CGVIRSATGEPGIEHIRWSGRETLNSKTGIPVTLAEEPIMLQIAAGLCDILPLLENKGGVLQRKEIRRRVFFYHDPRTNSAGSASGGGYNGTGWYCHAQEHVSKASTSSS